MILLIANGTLVRLAVPYQYLRIGYVVARMVCQSLTGLWIIAIGAFKMIVAKFAVVLAVINVQKITLPLAVLLMSSRILVVNASVPMTSNASCQEREMELFANPIMIVSRDHVRANVAMLVVLAMNAKNVDLWGGIVLNVKMVSFLKAFLALVNANVLTDASIVIVVSARLVIQPNTFLKMENANLNMVMVRYVKARKNVHLVAAWVDTVVKNQLCILAQNVTVVVNVKCVWEVTPCVVITKKNKDSARKQLVQLSQVFAVALVVLIVIIQVLMATTIVVSCISIYSAHLFFPIVYFSCIPNLFSTVAMANNCPCSRPGCYMECQVQKTCWIGSIASKLTDYEPVFECKTGIDCEGNIPSMTPTKVPNKCIDKEVKFFYKKQKKRFLLKTCKWLLTKNKKQRKKICSKYVDYFSKKKKNIWSCGGHMPEIL
mmetsp:Transcript_34969/g.80882  ORF Transcript_34969/g.80882 Transcript_34969/m.80882 type:complete len:431 (+) Transcript_34969:1947-3239(+)